MTDTPITAALEASDDPLTAPMWLKWRVGEDGRSIYAMPNGHPLDYGDLRIGRMFERQFAEEVVNAHNACLSNVQRPDFYRSPTGESSHD